MVNLTLGSMGQPDISASWCNAMWLFLQVSQSSTCDLLGDEEGSLEQGNEGSRRGQGKSYVRLGPSCRRATPQSHGWLRSMTCSTESAPLEEHATASLGAPFPPISLPLQPRDVGRRASCEVLEYNLCGGRWRGLSCGPKNSYAEALTPQSLRMY